MPSSIAQSMRLAGHAALTTLGRTVTVLKVTETLDKISGRVTDSTTRTDVTAYLAKYKREEVDGSAVLNEDRKIWISAKDVADAGITLEKEDRIIIGSETWQMIEIKEYTPGDTATLYWAQIRK